MLGVEEWRDGKGRKRKEETEYWPSVKYKYYVT
jgi:hypothetical protein